MNENSYDEPVSLKNSLTEKTESARIPSSIIPNEENEVYLEKETSYNVINNKIKNETTQRIQMQIHMLNLFISGIDDFLQEDSKAYEFDLNKCYSWTKWGSLIKKNDKIAVLLSAGEKQMTLVYCNGVKESFTYLGKEKPNRTSVDFELLKNIREKSQKLYNTKKESLELEAIL